MCISNIGRRALPASPWLRVLMELTAGYRPRRSIDPPIINHLCPLYSGWNSFSSLMVTKPSNLRGLTVSKIQQNSFEGFCFVNAMDINQRRRQRCWWKYGHFIYQSHALLTWPCKQSFSGLKHISQFIPPPDLNISRMPCVYSYLQRAVTVTANIHFQEIQH